MQILLRLFLYLINLALSYDFDTMRATYFLLFQKYVNGHFLCVKRYIYQYRLLQTNL